MQVRAATWPANREEESSLIRPRLQSLAARLGVATEKHLAQHCRDQYSPLPRFMLWIM